MVMLLLSYVTACGLTYDVDSLSTDYKDCGGQGQRCCAGGVCGEHLACVVTTGPDAAAADAGDAAAVADATADSGSPALPDSGGCNCGGPFADAAAADGAPDVAADDAAPGDAGACTCGTLVCTHCGDPGEPCCAGNSPCSSVDLSCDQGRCTGCGGKGEDCCDGVVRCATDEDLQCSGGKCVAPCGGSGQTCCNGSCDPGLECDPQGTCQSVPCGADGEPCCGQGAPCALANLKCVAGSCTACGLSPGQPCCDSTQRCADGMMCDGTEHCASCGQEGQPCCPTGCTGNLRCGTDGHCDTCPNAGTWCGSTQPNGSVCIGVGDASQCRQCGGLGQPCCPGGVPDQACPGTPTCCNGSGHGCTLCSTGSCTCKACCVQCGNWKPTNYVTIAASASDCPTQAANYCAGKGGKAYGQWSPSCPP